MTRKRLTLVFGAVALVLLLAAGYGYGRYRRARAQAAPETVLPTFIEPGAGPRAPRAEALGVRIGRSTALEVDALAREAGLACKDTSMRALMDAARAKKSAEAIALGEDPDVVSGASWNRPSKRERNPQVRLSCEDTPAERLRDWKRLPSVGRVLFVFDSPEHPVRHASFQRTHADVEAALRDFRETAAHYEAALGPPTTSKNDLPAEGAPLPRLRPFTREWKFADLRIKVEAIRYGGKRGVTLSEAVEVPWPVRADAPSLPHAP